MDKTSSIGALKGIGAKTEQLFHNLGVYTIGDILLHYPRDYDKLPPITPLADLAGLMDGTGPASGSSARDGKENNQPLQAGSRFGHTENKQPASGQGIGYVHTGENQPLPEQDSGHREEMPARRLEEATVAVAARVDKAPSVRAGRNMQVTSLTLKERGVSLDLVWFRMPYLKSTLKPGNWFLFLGKAVRKGKQFHMEQPQIFQPEKYEAMQESLWPCYPLTAGLGKNKLSQAIKQALEALDLSVDYLPEDIRARRGLAEYNFAIENIHFPESGEALEQARKRLIFDEFFQFILSAGIQKGQMEEIRNGFSFLPLEEGLASQAAGEPPEEGVPFQLLEDGPASQAAGEPPEEGVPFQPLEEGSASQAAEKLRGQGSQGQPLGRQQPGQPKPIQPLWADMVIKNLPYQLTGAQQRTLREIRMDLRGRKVMQRLVQGDVGSGKTILAFLAMLDVSQSGYQSALMAPTEVLAVQHFQTFTSLCEENGLNVPIILLTGTLGQKEKRRAYERMQLYPNAMVIGTHALIQERALYDSLALVITDEQHRFGVKQRETLFLKGSQPHILVMSATPIPRTLAIILYGDLDISVVDEVPAKRLPVKSCVVGKSSRNTSYEFLRKEISLGHQAYVICPLVEESEGLEAENVTDYAETLKRRLPPDAVVETLHGKMKSGRKNLIMEQFARNEIQVLVSTTVIEVGVNVPNATVIMIEDAQRFGLAQLHQLRGRVGRGDAQSYCIMINTTDSSKAKKRLEILNQSNDGFFIAGEDLKLRGPGDFFGIRQSGLLEFRLGDIYQNSDLLKQASEEANLLLSEDRMLELPEHGKIKEQIQYFLDRQGETVNL